MQLSGPVFLSTTGQIITTEDPAKYSVANARVQIQNFSGFLITAQIGGIQYLLPSLSASTIPTRGNSTLVLEAKQANNAFGQAVNMVWLLEGEEPAMADGPLTLANTQSLGLLTVSSYNDAGFCPTGTTLLATAPDGYIYSIYSVSIYSSAGSGTANYSIDAAGDSPGFTISYATTAPTSPEMMNGFLMKGLFVCSSSVPLQGSIRYDIFPAPIS